ncbi:MAG: preprotein translocase subunit SecG [Parvicella sp.]|jgi:preprotein translocase subunit SecG
MYFINTPIKWILIILFFPLSLIFVAYYKQKKAKKEYYAMGEDKDDEFLNQDFNN